MPVTINKLSLTVQYGISDRSLNQHLPRWRLRRWVQKAQEQDLIIALRWVDQEEGLALNHAFRGKNYATNVLTFTYPPSDPKETLQGDIALCWPIVQQEAAQQNKTIIAHAAHLVIHGVLHLQGYDHEVAQDALTMESKEIAILAMLGFENPYQG